MSEYYSENMNTAREELLGCTGSSLKQIAFVSRFTTEKLFQLFVKQTPMFDIFSSFFFFLEDVKSSFGHFTD